MYYNSNDILTILSLVIGVETLFPKSWKKGQDDGRP